VKINCLCIEVLFCNGAFRIVNRLVDFVVFKMNLHEKKFRI